MFFWIVRNEPGICARWFLDHKSPIVIQPGEPLDMTLSADNFKEMMEEHKGLFRSISADARYYLHGLTLASLGFCIALVAWGGYCFHNHVRRSLLDIATAHSSCKAPVTLNDDDFAWAALAPAPGRPGAGSPPSGWGFALAFAATDQPAQSTSLAQ
jgi:hypothetical protein